MVLHGGAPATGPMVFCDETDGAEEVWMGRIASRVPWLAASAALESSRRLRDQPTAERGHELVLDAASCAVRVQRDDLGLTVDAVDRSGCR